MKLAVFLRKYKSHLSSGSPVLRILAIVKCDETDYCTWYHGSLSHYIQREFKCGYDWKQQRDTYFALAKLYQRWQRFRHWINEERHSWALVQEQYYADNSQGVVERSVLTGETRQRMTLAPGGDLCF